jgi:hypothetical protein
LDFGKLLPTQFFPKWQNFAQFGLYVGLPFGKIFMLWFSYIWPHPSLGNGSKKLGRGYSGSYDNKTDGKLL